MYFGFGWLAQLVEHLVYTDLALNNQTIINTSNHNTNKLHQLEQLIKPAVQ
jgi:hypothetical protein